MPHPTPYDMITATAEAQYLRGILTVFTLLFAALLLGLTVVERRWLGVSLSLLVLLVISRLAGASSPLLLTAETLLFSLAVLFALRNWQSNRDAVRLLRLQATREELAFAQRLLEDERRERQRIASDLHDGLGSLFSVARRYLERPDNFTPHPAAKYISSAQVETRRLSEKIYPKALFAFGIHEALSDRVAEYDGVGGIRIFFVHGDLPVLLDPPKAYAVYSIVEELLTVAVRRRGVKNVTLQLTVFDDYLNLIVEDDGRGYEHNIFPDERVKSDIQLRLRALAGTAQVDNFPGRGTVVIVDIPL